MRIAQTAVCLVFLALALSVPRPSAQTQDHTFTPMEIEAGSRLYADQCSLCHGPNGDGVANVDLRRNRYRKPMSDDDLRKAITVGNADQGMPAFKLTAEELNGLIAFIRAGFEVSNAPVRLGDAARGRAVFTGTGECQKCHRVDGVGSRLAPDLSDIGQARQPAAIQRKLLDPTRTMLPINRPVRALTRDGKTIKGRRLNEDTFTVQIIDEQERLLTLTKADLREYELGTTSPMPSVAGKLTPDELADLVAYLSSLKGAR
jgi:putative heme-binding domain-containing protein